MGNGVIGKILYFWIFIVGGLIFARMFGFIDDDKKTIIIFSIAIAVVYIVFQLFRFLGRKKREERQENNKPPVHKGQSKKKKR